jgi:hypothetical protein
MLTSKEAAGARVTLMVISVERSMQISRTALSCSLRAKAYPTDPAGATFSSGRRTL